MKPEDIDIIRQEFGEVTHSTDKKAIEELFTAYNLDTNIHRSIEQTHYAIDKLQKAENGEKLVFSLNVLANDFLQKGRINIAIEFSNQAMESAQDLELSVEKARTILIRGKLAFTVQNYHYALELFTTAIEIVEKLDDSELYISLLINIGNVYKKLERWDDAISKYRYGLELAQNIQNKKQIASILNNIGNIHLKLKHYHEALEYYNKSLEVIKPIDDNKKTATSLNNIGLVYKCQGNYDKALKYLKKAGEICLDSDSNEGKIVMLINTANVNTQKGEFEIAKEKLDLAWETIKREELCHLKGVLFLSQSNLYENIGDFEKALEYYKEFKNISDISSKNLQNCNSISIPTEKKTIVHSISNIIGKKPYEDHSGEAFDMMANELANLRKQQNTYIKRIAFFNSFLKSSIKSLIQNLQDDKKAEFLLDIFETHKIMSSTIIDSDKIFYDKTAFILYLMIINQFNSFDILEFEEKSLCFLKLCKKEKVSKNILVYALDILQEFEDTHINAELLGITNYSFKPGRSLYACISKLMKLCGNLKTDDICKEIQSEYKNLPKSYISAFCNAKNLKSS